jgi:hypothetical protein
MTVEPRPHDELRMSGAADVWIAVAPEVAYGAVSDLPRMGEWSPENRGGDWVGERRAVVGATFRGRNASRHGEWETLVTVIEAEPPSAFAFRVAAAGQEGTTWRFTFRAERGGTVVEETFAWHWTPLPDEGFRGRVGRMPIEQATAAVAEREQHLRQQIDTTLAALKRALEAHVH